MAFSTLLDTSLYNQSYPIIAISAVAVMLSAGMTYLICTIKFTAPKGLNIPLQKYPQLAKFIDAAEKQTLGLKIHTIKLVDTFELRIEKTPVFGIPIWSKNSLILGFSYMQSLPPNYFTYLLTRKLKQYGKRHVIGSWVRRTQQIWEQYPRALRKKRPGDQITYWFFKLYSRLNKRMALYAIQEDEMYADTDTLNFVNSEDYLLTMEMELAARMFLQKQYWPAILDMVKRRKRKPNAMQPFLKLPAALQKGLSNEKLKTYLQQHWAVTINKKTELPPLRQRMDNIGHHKLKLPVVPTTSAAQFVFGKDYAQIVVYMDKQWTGKMNSVVLGIIKKASNKLRLVEDAA